MKLFNRKKRECELGKINEQIKEVKNMLGQMMEFLKDIYSEISVVREVESMAEDIVGTMGTVLNKASSIEAEVERRLNNYNKELLDKFFSMMEIMMNWNKEVGLASLYKSVGLEDGKMNQIRSQLLKPLLEAKWALDRYERIKKINEAENTFGGRLLKMRDNLKRTILEKDRKNLNVEKEKAYLEILEQIIRECEK